MLRRLLARVKKPARQRALPRHARTQGLYRMRTLVPAQARRRPDVQQQMPPGALLRAGTRAPRRLAATGMDYCANNPTVSVSMTIIKPQPRNPTWATSGHTDLL